MFQKLIVIDNVSNLSCGIKKIVFWKFCPKRHWQLRGEGGVKNSQTKIIHLLLWAVSFVPDYAGLRPLHHVLSWCDNVCSIKKDTKPRSNTLLRLVSFFSEQTLFLHKSNLPQARKNPQFQFTIKRLGLFHVCWSGLNPSIRDRVYRNENFVEIIPVWKS